MSPLRNTPFAKYQNAIAFAITMIVVAAGFFYLGRNAQTAKTNAQRNSDAILVSCRLLKNAIIEAQSGSGDATRLYVLAIKRIMSPSERRELDRALRHGAQLTIPDCQKIAKHPETVRDELVRR